MDINNILTEIEYTKERSAKELLEFVNQKGKELRAWSRAHSGTKALREMKYRELGKGLPNKFAHEITPLAYYAENYYSDSNARFKPCCASESYDGIIIDNGNEIVVEVTNAIDGKIWGLQKELLTENTHAPWEYNIHGVKGNKTKRNRSVSDIITSDDLFGCEDEDIVCRIKELVEKAASKKCTESIGSKLPYGQNKTILIVTFDETGFSRKAWDDFVNFKQDTIDSMEHNFRKITLFGWLDKRFVE